MNQKKLSADKKTVAVGPGNRWKEVYDYLTPYNLAIVGGQASDVGVGGLTLGGGISHHTNQYGLACDNIASFELVTAKGAIINVSYDTFPDLYWALRGGSNNFGIITTFNYETLSQGPMFASKRQYNISYAPALIDAFGNAVDKADEDHKLAHFVAVSYYSGSKLASADMPDGFRTTMWSQSFKLNTDLMKWIMQHLWEVAPGIPEKAPSISFQAFTKPALQAMQKKGGNSLGLYPEDGPFFHALFYMSWTDEKDDKAVLKAAQSYLSDCVAKAKELGADNDYMCMPYSSPYEPVISGYGATNVAKLNAVSKEYDPDSVFQKLQLGYFKLSGKAPFGQVV
ncbi:GlcD, FADFMN-containing dehydrogenase [Pyrenophora tritici-repentis]|nr:GlcD, FADFMN-containing dehydrogenase [Pyrenophora tritici-repentis]